MLSSFSPDINNTGPQLDNRLSQTAFIQDTIVYQLIAVVKCQTVSPTWEMTKWFFSQVSSSFLNERVYKMISMNKILWCRAASFLTLTAGDHSWTTDNFTDCFYTSHNRGQLISVVKCQAVFSTWEMAKWFLRPESKTQNTSQLIHHHYS